MNGIMIDGFSVHGWLYRVHLARIQVAHDILPAYRLGKAWPKQMTSAGLRWGARQAQTAGRRNNAVLNALFDNLTSAHIK